MSWSTPAKHDGRDLLFMVAELFVNSFWNYSVNTRWHSESIFIYSFTISSVAKSQYEKTHSFVGPQVPQHMTRQRTLSADSDMSGAAVVGRRGPPTAKNIDTEI